MSISTLRLVLLVSSLGLLHCSSESGAPPADDSNLTQTQPDAAATSPDSGPAAAPKPPTVVAAADAGPVPVPVQPFDAGLLSDAAAPLGSGDAALPPPPPTPPASIFCDVLSLCCFAPGNEPVSCLLSAGILKATNNETACLLSMPGTCGGYAGGGGYSGGGGRLGPYCSALQRCCFVTGSQWSAECGRTQWGIESLCANDLYLNGRACGY